MPSTIPDRFSPGQELTADIIDALLRERARWRRAFGDQSISVDYANSDMPPRFSSRAGPSTDTTTYIQLTNTADSTFGGYAWQAVKWAPALSIVATGSGYTSGTVSFSPTYASGSDAPTATYDVDSNGRVVTVNITHAGSKMTGLTASVSGGTGATLLCILDGGSLTGGGWVDISGQDGSVGPNDSHGNPTPGDLAYESTGALVLGARIADSGGNYYHEATYPAVRDSGGRLLFFCRSTFLARTKSVSSYPSSVNVFYGMETLQLTNSIPTEGASGTITGSGNTFYAYNVGSTAPPVGSYVVCSMISSAVGPYFVFRYDA